MFTFIHEEPYKDEYYLKLIQINKESKEIKAKNIYFITKTVKIK